MLKALSPSLLALGAGALAVLVHPAADARFALCLCAYIVAGSFVASPLLRYLLPVAGTAGFEVYCFATMTTGLNNETEFAAFILMAFAWAALLEARTTATPRRAALCVALAAASTAGAFGFTVATDRFVAAYAPFSRREAFADPLHLAQMALCAIVFFLAVWLAASLAHRRRDDKLCAYAETYVACRRDLERLWRKTAC